MDPDFQSPMSQKAKQAVLKLSKKECTQSLALEGAGGGSRDERAYALHVLNLLHAGLSEIPEKDFTSTNVTVVMDNVIKTQLRVAPKVVLIPLRFALTGEGSGPGLPSTAEILGKTNCINRLRRAMDQFNVRATLPLACSTLSQ